MFSILRYAQVGLDLFGCGGPALGQILQGLHLCTTTPVEEEHWHLGLAGFESLSPFSFRDYVLLFLSLSQYLTQKAVVSKAHVSGHCEPPWTGRSEQAAQPWGLGHVGVHPP